MSLEMIRLKPTTRKDYPNLLSKTELRKMGLMPRANVKPRAIVIRGMGYKDYFLYDSALTTPYKKSMKEKKKEKARRIELKEQYTCPKCGKYIGVQKSWELEEYGGICGACWKVNYNQFKEELSKSLQLPAVSCDNPTKGIVFDLETTGLEADSEILQISIIDLDGKELLNSYVKPFYTRKWESARRIHGISEKTVKDAPYIFELIPKLKGIFANVETIVGYNVGFDLGYMKDLGIDIPECEIFDVMQEFSPLYGQWNDYYQSYTWQKLSVCADYFGYEFSAHDSLEDVRATLFCCNKIKELIQSGEYGKILEMNNNYNKCEL